MDPFGKFRKLGRGGKDPEASKGGALSTTTSSMSKAGTPSLKPSVTTSCQAEEDAPEELGEVVGKGEVTGAVVDCIRHLLRSLLRGCCSSSERPETTGAKEEVGADSYKNELPALLNVCSSRKADIKNHRRFYAKTVSESVS